QQQLGTLELPAEVSLAVSGLTTDPKLAAKVELWRREQIGLPLAILDDPVLVKRVHALMSEAAWVARLLRQATYALVWALSERQKLRKAVTYLHTGKLGQEKLPPAVSALASGLGVLVSFWSALETPFRNMLF